MRKLFIFPLLFLLAGCAALAQVSAVKVNPTLVIVAANTFNALEATATNYIRLPACVPENRPICREPEVAAIIIPAVYSGRSARNGLRDFYRKYPNTPLGPQGLFDALTSTNDILQQIFAQHKIGSK